MLGIGGTGIQTREAPVDAQSFLVPGQHLVQISAAAESRTCTAGTEAPRRMNNAKLSNPFGNLLYRIMLGTRRLRPSPTCEGMGSDRDDVVERIHVINLDRQDERWRQVRRELSSVRDIEGRRLTEIARRISAVDARHHVDRPDEEVQHDYSLADQLFVDPEPLPDSGRDACSLRIMMTGQEAAVARSHISVWKQVAEGSLPYTLILEDDVYLRRGFAKTFERLWAELKSHGSDPAFDLLYLSYKEARTGAEMAPVSRGILRPYRGLWHLSGYVLSKRGAQRLLDLLPVRGPVDLWMNHQFAKLEVLAIRRPIVSQRLDCPSSNSYSVLPILSKIGVLTREKPATIRVNDLPVPVFASGQIGTGLTQLSTALSMLGYRCCSDVAALPAREHQALFEKQRTRVFNAYVNVGSLRLNNLIELAKTYPLARFIVTTDAEPLIGRTGIGSTSGGIARVPAGDVDVPRALLCALREHLSRVLVLPAAHPDKWQLLCGFLGCEYPSYRYPECADQGQRALAGYRDDAEPLELPEAIRLRWDSLPWIADMKGWRALSWRNQAPIRSDSRRPTRRLSGSGSFLVPTGCFVTTRSQAT